MATFEWYSSRTKRRRVCSNVQKYFIGNVVDADADDENSVVPCHQTSVSSLSTLSSTTQAQSFEQFQPTDEREPEVSQTDWCNQKDSHSIDVPDEVESDTDNDMSDIPESGSESFDDIPEIDSSLLHQKLSEWTVSFNVSHACLSSLLKILRSCNIDLPADPRTVLRTPRKYVVKEIAGGKYHHFGLSEGISCCAESVSLDELNSRDLSLQINVDGLPLFKSSSVSLWPILGRIKEFSSCDPFVIGIFAGSSKPASVDEYLEDFIQDVEHVHSEGILLKGQRFNVAVDAFICDAPARSFLKCIKGHSGFSSCERCTVEGVSTNRRVIFDDFDASL